MTDDSAKPVTLWRDGILWSDCPRLDGTAAPEEYRALPVAEFEALRRRVEEAEAVSAGYLQALGDYKFHLEQAESRADAAEAEVRRLKGDAQ